VDRAVSLLGAIGGYVLAPLAFVSLLQSNEQTAALTAAQCVFYGGLALTACVCAALVRVYDRKRAGFSPLAVATADVLHV
jgi:hypothetical protein